MDRKLPVLSSSCVCVCVCPAGLLLSSNTLECCYGLTPQTNLKHTLERSSHFCSAHTQKTNTKGSKTVKQHGRSLVIMKSFYTHTHTHRVVQVKVAAGLTWRISRRLCGVSVREHVCSAVTPTHCRFDMFEVNYRKSVYDDITHPFNISVRDRRRLVIQYTLKVTSNVNGHTEMLKVEAQAFCTDRRWTLINLVNSNFSSISEWNLSTIIESEMKFDSDMNVPPQDEL